MAAPTTGRSTATDSEATGSRPQKENIGWGWRIAAVVVGMLLITVGWHLGGSSQKNRDNNKLDSMAAQSRQIEVDTVQRELRAYANIKGLPVSNVTVTRNDAGIMMATWQQGFQTCTVPVLQPVNGSALWTTLKVKEGSGACSTDSGSGGIGNGQPVKPGG